MIFHAGRCHYYYSLFQPIVWLEHERVYGHEALLRSTEQVSPEQLFHLARANRTLYELDNVRRREDVGHRKAGSLFWQGAIRNKAKQKLVSLFVEYCGKECLLGLEGIEHPDDLSVARSSE
jgi:hypothetical protein